MALRTEHAEVRREMHVHPSQNVTSAKSVGNKQPEKDFVVMLAR